MKRLILIAASLAISTPAFAVFCPSYSSSSGTNPGNCGVASATGTDPTSDEWDAIIAQACLGPDGPDWMNGPSIPTIGAGCGTPAQVSPVFPCELVQAIAMQESARIQFCGPTSPADQVGLSPRTIVAQDCGYGVVQVTTGMHVGETPDWDRDRVAGDPLYALQTGLKILAEKWRVTSCVGDNQPSIIEDWYLATWAYNSYAFVNNPNNPNFDAARPVCDPNVSCAGRPYQERIWGWMEHPPMDRWNAITPAYPDLAEIPSTTGTKVPNLSDAHCASPTSCTSTRTTHTSICAQPEVNDLAVAGDAAISSPDLATVTMMPVEHGCGCTLGAQKPSAGAWLIAALLAISFFASRRRSIRR